MTSHVSSGLHPKAALTSEGTVLACAHCAREDHAGMDLRAMARHVAEQVPPLSQEGKDDLKRLFDKFRRESRSERGSETIRAQQRVRGLMEGRGTPDFSSLGPVHGPPTPVPTALYRHYDSDGVLLYIGITNNPRARDASHRAASRWFELADPTRATHEDYPARELAAEAETVAITVERPLFNRSKTDRDYRSTIEYLAEHNRLDLLTIAWG